MMAAETRSCFGCGQVTTEPVDKCQKCGRRLRTAKHVRRLGAAQLLLGLVLAGFMGTVAYRLLPMLLYPGAETAGGGRFTGTAEQAKLILGLFGLVIAFGLGSMASGLYQLKTGRRNNLIFVLMLALFVLLIAAAWFVTQALGH